LDVLVVKRRSEEDWIPACSGGAVKRWSRLSAQQIRFAK
jgi:hypothetical protein